MKIENSSIENKFKLAIEEQKKITLILQKKFMKRY